jgi:hypothetical protein
VLAETAGPLAFHAPGLEVDCFLKTKPQDNLSWGFLTIWTDFLLHLPYEVETDMDHLPKQQSPNIIVIRKTGLSLTKRMPDGFENLAHHNLLNFKSYLESLNAWAIFELIGYYINYRKKVSPNLDNLLPESDFRLFVVCVAIRNSWPQNGQWCLSNKAFMKSMLGHWPSV